MTINASGIVKNNINTVEKNKLRPVILGAITWDIEHFFSDLDRSYVL